MSAGLADDERRRLFQGVRRVVVKLGTTTVTSRGNGLNRKLIDRLAGDVAQLQARGIQVGIVSSGAVGAGMGRLKLKQRPRRLQDVQATAAVGQGLLMNAYKLAFRKYGIPVGQVLLTSDDLDHRRRYVNARNTLEALFRFQVVPVINENDSVAVEELNLSVGDNDRLSALVSHLVDADLLIILTDVGGLYTDNPSRNKDARLISRVEQITPELLAGAGDAGSSVSLGGMRSKVRAAQSVTHGGRMMVIASGRETGICEILDGRAVGTLFLAGKNRLTDRKMWIVNSRKRGVLVVDEGAAEAIGLREKSLLPSGILSTEGEFDAGEPILVQDRRGREIAHGMARYSSEDVRRILGKRTDEVAAILNVPAGTAEVIHRDDLVIL
ncbi:MAG: glutamate 5-kinase [bacterium]|nr:glutamate 5-kinase [bacterium]